jgi:hypothetical protein
MEKTIRLAYGKLTPTSFTELHDFQGDLKELTKESYEKIKKEMVETGFAFAPHAWKDPKRRKLFLIDGHQRIKALRRLAKDGYKIPKIPTVIVEAKSHEEAKRRVLQGVSQYGHVTQQGLYDFTVGAKLDPKLLEVSFDIPGIDLSAFNLNFFGDKTTPNKEGAQEIHEDEIGSKLVHTCPKCNFTFS